MQNVNELTSETRCAVVDQEGHHIAHYGQRLEAQQDQQAGGHHGLTSLITMTDGEVTPACPVCLGLSLIIIVTSQCP